MVQGGIQLHGILFACLLALGLPACFPSWSYALTACLVALCVVAVLPKYRVFALASLLGFSISIVQLYQRIESQLPSELEGRALLIDLEVVGLPQERGSVSESNQFVRFDARVNALELLRDRSLAEGLSEEELALDAMAASMRGRDLRLSWRRSSASIRTSAHLEPGQRWLLQVRLRRPRGTANPQGFDYQAWLLQKNISATGYVLDRPSSALLSAPGNSISSTPGQLINRHRYVLAKHLERALTVEGESNERFGLLQALTIGEKSDITPEQWTLLNATGTTHLMAISGLHVGLVALCTFFLGRWVLQLVFVLRAPLFIRLLPALVSIFASGFYAVLAGFAIPTQRALILVVLLQLAYVSGRKVDPLTTLLLVAVVVCVGDPFAFMHKGFWLSFGAVASLMWFGAYRTARLSWWRATLASQGVVFVGLCFPLAILGLPVSLVSPFANLVAVPIVSFFCIPPLLLGALFASVSHAWAASLFRLSDFVLEYVLVFLRGLSALAVMWDAGVVNINIPWYVGVVCIVVSLLLFVPRQMHLRPFFALVLIASFVAAWPAKNAFLTVLDVGQGLSIYAQIPAKDFHRAVPAEWVVKAAPAGAVSYDSPSVGLGQVDVAVDALPVSRGKVGFVFDTGARHSADFDLGSRTLAPFILAGGARQVDLAVVSHADNDHAGGLSGLAKNLSLGVLVTGRQEGVLAKELDLLGDTKLDSVKECRAGMAWLASGPQANMKATVLWPLNGMAADSGMSRNNLSCVVLLEINGARVLLTGDIEREVERRLVALYPEELSEVDVLLAPHHGSKTSSSTEFVQLLNPRFVVVSAGYRNRYRHPSPIVMERYRKSGAQIYNTAVDGAIMFNFADSGRFEILAERENAPRLWYSR